MTSFKQIRWTATVILMVGLVLAFSSGFVESEALAAEEGQFAHTAKSMAAKLFTVSAILILIWATEWQRAKMSARLQKLEEEISLIKRGSVSTSPV